MPLNYSKSSRLLIAVASAIEFKAVLNGFDVGDDEVPPLWKTREINDYISVLHTGVGKANAAAAAAKELARTNYGGVVSIGLAGSYDESIKLLSSVLGTKHWMLDEGTVTKKEPGWISLEEAGWVKSSVECDNGQLLQHCKSLVEHEGEVATISTISGTTELRDEYLRRAPVKIETMESCAIANVCFIENVEYADIRIISNFCGERTADNHDFPGALKQLANIVRKLVQSLKDAE